ncbi:MAG: DUF2085 domain-containing protein [Anaerolineae bacterium]
MNEAPPTIEKQRREPTAEEILAEAQRRITEREHGNGRESNAEAPFRRRTVQLLNRMVFWLSKHWIAVFNLALLLYVGLPFLAPTLLVAGYENAANALYGAYNHVCHQYPIRSWFLFGAQAAYRPGEALLPEVYHKAPRFLGSPTLGYKVAFCQRDVAIYGSMVLGGLIFGVLRKRRHLPSLPVWAYLVFGLLPMGLDGGYQLLSQLAAMVKPGLLPVYESGPIARTITGALFGLCSIALVYPGINDFFEDIQARLASRYHW